MTCRLLFVYGTLRRQSPHRMARYLAERARFLGPARVAGRLYDLGPYPGMIPAAADEDCVHGDLFELNEPDATLAELDRYEGAATPLPCLFQREETAATLAGGQTMAAWVYWYRGEVAENKHIVPGDYLPQLRSKFPAH